MSNWLNSYTTGNGQSYRHHTYLEEAMKSSQPEFYANASFSSQVLCPKHDISMYLGEYPAKR